MSNVYYNHNIFDKLYLKFVCDTNYISRVQRLFYLASFLIES